MQVTIVINVLLVDDHDLVRTGIKKILEDASTEWEFDMEKMKSQTSEESLVIKISNLNKKYE